MIAIRSILCLTDFSDFSSFAMDHAVALARWYGAEVTALPPPAGAFGVMPLEPRHWIVLAAFGPVLLMCEEARKALRRRI